MKLVPLDMGDGYIKACFINPETISSIVIDQNVHGRYYVVVNANNKDWCSRSFENEADAEKLMNEFIAECYVIEHGCENCSDYCCGARNEL